MTTPYAIGRAENGLVKTYLTSKSILKDFYRVLSTSPKAKHHNLTATLFCLNSQQFVHKSQNHIITDKLTADLLTRLSSNQGY